MLDFLSATYIAAVLSAYVLIGCIRRLYFHPLSTVPGPVWAALTRHYATYYEVVKDGGLVDQLQRLHAIHGPVVRIGPNALHFSNPDVYSEIYTRGFSFLKDPALYRAFGQQDSSFGSTDPVFAKARRDIISPLFSRRAILKLEPFVQQKIDKLIGKLLGHEHSSDPIDMFRAFKSVTLDIILTYCFGESCDALDAPDFAHPVIIDLESTSRLLSVFKVFQWVIPAQAFVTKLLKPLGHRVPGRAVLREQLLARIDKTLADPTSLESASHETVYHLLMQAHPDKGFAEVPSRASLLDEATNLQAAGSHTVAATCIVGFYHILNNKDVYHRLFAELKEAIPDVHDSIRFEDVEKLPYLTAVIKEALRLSHGVVLPMLRIVNTDGVVLDGIVVPRGTTVAIGSTFVHLNSEVFPDPHSFNPDRWLQEGSDQLEHYLVSFSRGQRNCLGMNLAWCELYALFASIYRRLNMELYGSSPKDMEFRAHFIPVFKGNHVRAFVKPMKS
ncbi:cytochrome P450 [Schizophyllum amplum]|uniref:Cytochrome P450 n=1 Tax=Schizophyllum amplum TaxID=97359 RepID=A0A550CTR1_9AGAR|nr:cytochrome P450 [Auriculariopsis ampla]